MSRLHTAMLACGFGCGEEEMEFWLFGEMTKEAVFTFQASESIPETGARWG